MKAKHVNQLKVTDFILDGPCQAAEQTRLDQRLFMVSGSQYPALMDLLERPELFEGPGTATLRWAADCGTGRHSRAADASRR